MEERSGEWDTLAVKMPVELKQWCDDTGDTMSDRARVIIENWQEAEEELGLRDDLEGMQLAVLRTYRNAIVKNIQTMEVQKEMIEKQIREMEEGETEEVLFTVELDIDGESV